MSGKLTDALDPSLPTIEEEAAETFVRRLHGEWTAADQVAFEARLERDPAYANAYARAEASWDSLGAQAEAPELMAYREEAIAYARKASAGRRLTESRYMRRPWRMAASAACIALAIATAWQLSPYGYTPGQYSTGIGEQRIIELSDHSRITLDAATRLGVHYSNDVRIVQLQQGQAQFSVAKDPARPFKVVAGRRTIIAVGTVFTVEYVNQKVHVAMMEGKVTVVEEQPSSGLRPPSPTDGEGQGVKIAHHEPSRTRQHDTIELIAGEELRVDRDDQNTVNQNADIEAATAWREGKIIIRSEPLGEVVQRLNRYSRRQIQIDDAALATKLISGVFEAGDTQGFVSAVQRYLPVTINDSDSSTIKLAMR